MSGDEGIVLSEEAKAELLEAGKAAIEELAGDGLGEDEALDMIADILDAVLPMRALIPGPAGLAAELGDGPAIRHGLGVLADCLDRNVPKRLRRAAELEGAGEKAKAARIRKRMKRAAERQGLDYEQLLAESLV